MQRITSTSAIFAAGATTGESSRAARPRVASLRAVPASAGSAMETAISPIIRAASTSTTWPSSRCSVSGMVTGAATVETRIVASESAGSPPSMLVHMADTTATGTLYSSTMPQTRLGLVPKSAVASAHATHGMATVASASETSIGSGRRTTRARLPKVLESELWNVMNAKSAVTAGLRTENWSGKSTPSTTHAGETNAMWLPMKPPSRFHASMLRSASRRRQQDLRHGTSRPALRARP